MKEMKLMFVCLLVTGALCAQDLKPIVLSSPDKTRGKSVMEALSERASVREWSSKPLSIQDLSDLLWAANGINRSNGKRTAPSAMNAQDVDIYVFNADGIYLYDATNSTLNPVVTGDHRDLAGKSDAPVTLVLISETSRFRMSPGSNRSAAQVDSVKLGLANLDAGIVSQNISVFCAGMGLKTVPRASFPAADKIRELLSLKPTQYVLLNHPVGYEKE